MTIMANMSRGSGHCFSSGCSSDRRCPYSEQLAISEGTGASFKLKLIDKLTPPYKRSC